MSRKLWPMVVSAGLHLQASAQTFNERFDLFGEGNGQWAWGVEAKPDGSALVIFNGDYTLDGLYYSSGVSSVLIDPTGIFSEGFRLHIPLRANYPGWANCATPLQSGGYVLGGSTAAVGDTNRAVLYWMDDDGLILNYHELALPGRSWIGRQAKQTLDGGYVIVGETSTVGYLDGFLAKTDAQGEVEWVRTYGGAMSDYIVAVDANPQGGWFLGGQVRDPVANKQLWVQAVNDTGAVVWSKIWGTDFDEPNAHLITTSDGHIVVAAAWGVSPLDHYVKYMAKLHRDDGSVIWSRTYGVPCQGCPLFAAVELADGGFIAASHHFGGGTYQGVLLRTDSQGDSLWMRSYHYVDSSVPAGRGMFRDVQPTPDGGFIAAGVAMAVPGVYGQDVWVVKVDSMGCLEPGCHLITGMETQITNLRGALTVAPNPVARGMPVQVEVRLPEGFAVQGELRLTVTDAMGRLVQEERLGSSTRNFINLFSTSGALRGGGQPPTGTYHLHLHDATRWIAGAKLVVE